MLYEVHYNGTIEGARKWAQRQLTQEHFPPRYVIIEERGDGSGRNLQWYEVERVTKD